MYSQPPGNSAYNEESKFRRCVQCPIMMCLRGQLQCDCALLDSPFRSIRFDLIPISAAIWFRRLVRSKESLKNLLAFCVGICSQHERKD